MREKRTTIMNKYKYFFGCLQRSGGAAMQRLLNIYGNEEIIYSISDRELRECGALTCKQADELCELRKSVDIDRAYAELTRRGISCTCMTDMEYPKRLQNIASKPYMLFYYGELPEEKSGSVAIIGARMCSDYGRKCAKYFAEGLAVKGIQIISGLAAGIDGIAQQAAIDNGGKSFGILGSGVDICYPSSNRALYDRLKQSGGIISEYPPGTKPIAQNFPMRNRIISGLSDIVLVVEAKPKSGTAITVSMALEQGRQVFAVPGRISDSLSQGCNHMIYEGASIASGVDVLLDELERIEAVRSFDATPDTTSNENNNIYDSLEDELEKMIYKAILSGAKNIESIAYAIGKSDSVQEVKSALMYMELRGIVDENLGEYEL